MNSCGECTLCCELFHIKEINKPAYQMCQYCDHGCKIYDIKPSECTAFDCAYLQGNSHIDLRPDKCGIIFEKLGEHIFHGTIRPNTELSDTAKGQIDSFVRQGFSVFVKDGDSYIKFLGEGHNREEITKEFDEQVRILNGGSIIHD